MVSSSGITPAYAGKSSSRSHRCARQQDHPRVCGEKSMILAKYKALQGSPPRMRGKVAESVLAFRWYRITPAYAGKSNFCVTLHWQRKDHPRVCGEKAADTKSTSIKLGSPPRMRGKADFDVCPDRQCGITPAYAGKRLKRSHSIGHFSCILCLFHSVLHRASVSDGSRAGPCAPPCLPAQNAVPV